MNAYQRFFNTVLCRLDPEFAHSAAMLLLKNVSASPLLRSLVRASCSVTSSKLTVDAFGMKFQHPLGLAAGLDKDAVCVSALHALGFSFVEVGTVTPIPQPGYPRPRLYRLLEERALINRMGFPSKGADVVFGNLKAAKVQGLPICISLGKNKETDLSLAGRDYCAVLKRLITVGDLFSVNVSSPNTPGLVQLQSAVYLREILAQLNECMSLIGADKPLLLKVSPDLSPAELDGVIDTALAFNIKGIIATNTTQERYSIRSPLRNQAGGLSGYPLKSRSTDVIRHIYKSAGNRLIIVGVGGIFTAEDAWEKVTAGASLLQAYTGLVYTGPTFVKEILLGLRQKLDQSGLESIQFAVGTN